MFKELLDAYGRYGSDQASESALLDLVKRLIPEKVTAQDLNIFLSEDRDEPDHVAVLWTTSIITTKISEDIRDGAIDTGDELSSVFLEITDQVSSLMLPICSGASPDEDTTNYAALRRKANSGIKILNKLANLPLQAPLRFQPSTLLRLAAFTDSADPWSTSSDAARKLLEAQLQQLDDAQKKSLIGDEILTKFLRPLFSKSRPAAITASGRKAEYVEQSRYDNADRETPETKPWKYAHRYAIAVFAWAVQYSDTTLLQSHWPLFTPVLLALLDESTVTIKIRALAILRTFWARCPPGLMRNTGLADVFEQAVFPAVLHLPTLTPEDESLQILSAAYPVLIEMAGLNYPSSDLEAKQPQQITEDQRKLIDKIVREGVMVGYHHAKEHIRLVGLFCETLVCIVNGMGIIAVKYLKDFIPMISEIMTDPFGTKHPPTLVSATQLLQTILRTCWPRIPHHCNEICKILMLCWLNVNNEESFSSEISTATNLKAELIKTGQMLSAVMKTTAKENLSKRVSPLIEKEPQLNELFGDIKAS
ncbi:uncharacterized protein F4822DRAFT_83069 [Hypoxylon trugodes]|uniref:uncharacterized protein n=1 Tax=Hypoxylon trugodes TaxID=326681 RepID=UPI00219F2C2F|nr:uncharacterized protein F4822DRAFT_83069 [Hypoxylon trugodes]KAI1383623.1 hypothetical protein F4822DRAFT_83069 [Hypoxylon trugodes]